LSRFEVFLRTSSYAANSFGTAKGDFVCLWMSHSSSISGVSRHFQTLGVLRHTSMSAQTNGTYRFIFILCSKEAY